MSENELKPLNIRQKLAQTPIGAPKYSVTIKNSAGREVALADPRCTRALVALMDQYAVTGGAAAHWGGPSAYAEINSAIHALMFEGGASWFDRFNYVNDAGHAENGVYALRANYGFDRLTFKDLTKFRSIESKLTGHGEGHLNPEGVFISNGPLGSGLPQAQGLALADSLSKNSRLTVCVLSDGASMEGEAKESFAAIPGLAAKGKMNPFVMVISDNNTKLSGRIDKDSFSMAPTFESLKTLGWDVTCLAEGHDLQKVYSAVEKSFQTAKSNAKKPVCLWIKTVKGFGVKATEESASGGHGYPLKAYDGKILGFINEIYAGSAPDEFVKLAEPLLQNTAPKKEESGVKTEKVQAGVARGMIKARSEGYPLYSISSDLAGSTGVDAFQKKFPDSYTDIGVAESNMVSTAVGLSKQGYIPVVDTFSQFGITKGNLPLIMSSLSQAPIVAIFSHAGFQDAADGASHQATTYYSAIASIPDVEIIHLSCADQAESYVYEAIKLIAKERESSGHSKSRIFFLGRENHPLSYAPNISYQYGKAIQYKSGDAATVVASGPMVPKALLAAELLEKKGVKISVIENPFVNAPDVELISKSVKGSSGKLITIEDHQLIAGMGAMVAHALLLSGATFKLKSLAIKGEFGQSSYSADELYKKHGIDEEAIIRLVGSY